MFRFAHPEYLFLLLPAVIPVAAFMRAAVLRKKNIKLWGNAALLATLMPNVSYARPRWKFYMQLVALILIIVVLAQPQFGTKEEKVRKKGIEVMIALMCPIPCWRRIFSPTGFKKQSRYYRN